MTAPSPDAPGQGEAGVGGEGGEVEALMPWPLTNIIHRPDVQRWLAAHDASVVAAARADAEGRLGEVRRVLADEPRFISGLRRAMEREGTTAPLIDWVDRVLDAAGPREGEEAP